MKKPKRVLCKRTSKIGNDYQVLGFRIIPYDNRMLVEGDWYDIVYNRNDTDRTFTIIDHHGDKHLFWMYEGDDTEDKPRSYTKWFYTEKEIRKMKLKKLNETILY